MDAEDEERLLRSVALKNAQSVLLARQRAERELLEAKDALQRKTEELAHSLSMMRATLEASSDGILVVGADGAITGFNQKFVDMWDLPRALVERREHRPLLLAIAQRLADPARFIARVDAILASAPEESFDLLELGDGRVFERFSRIQFLERQPVGRVWIVRDITDRRRAEQALRDESRVLELLNQTGGALAATLDLQALAQAVVEMATQLSGAGFGAFVYHAPQREGAARCAYAPAAPQGADAQMAGAPHPLALLPFGPLRQGDAPLRCDDVAAAPGAALRSYLAVPVVSRSGALLGGLYVGHAEPGVFNARTERLMAGVAAQGAMAIDNALLYEAARQAAGERATLLASERTARSQAERMSELKDEFLATLSHELRTPLSAILGWSQILRRGGRGEAELEKGLDIIERNARAQAQLIEDLLDMSRITSGKVRLDIQPVDPLACIEAAAETVRPAADAKGIHLELLLDATVGTVSADPGRLQQVVWNLLSNAIKFTPKNGRVVVALRRGAAHIDIGVSDTGLGIEPEFLPQVFERFRQADGSSTRRFGGLGLGLSIVKSLVELHGGTVAVDSAGAGAGTTFTVRLPLTLIRRAPFGAAPAQPAGPQPSAADFTPRDLSGLRVLVVDDEPDARALIERVLGDCGAQVSSAAGAVPALAQIGLQRPHVLVSDIGMPEVDGYELLKRVRALGVDGGGAVPAIALTAFARAEDRERALQAGFSTHLAKPVELSALVAAVAAAAGR